MRWSVRGVGAETSGVMAVIAGLAFVLERFGLVRDVWQWLPLFLVYLAARDVVQPLNGLRRTLVPLLAAVWLQIAVIGLFGVDLVNGWPLLVIVAGVGLVVDGVLESDRWRETSAGGDRS